MAFSIQTNVNSLIAQENLRVNSDFQSQTIQRLTSGYRINSSGDDAAGLAIANKFRSDQAELTQGVRNANDGISSLQIIDGGMSNVAKMLDRLRTLAAQSASQTFTGDRNVLNSEFQSLLTEIDRQAQSIGLDSNGQFAKTLSVFIGGGKTAGTGAISTANGTVSIDLTSSSVDTKALGLKGMQVVAGTADIGNGSAAHTVSQILGDANNTTGTAGYTDFYFAGAGFSGASKVKVSVNTQGVTDINSLVTAVNSAIQSAASGSTQAAAAFKSAGIVASVHTDDNGGQQLAFTSSTAAFQVEAGDTMANALLGNFGAGADGTAVGSTVTGGATTAGAFTPTGVTVRITGASLASPVDITFDSSSTTLAAAVTDLVNKVGADTNLRAAGITVAQSFNVEVTGDTSNVLGLGSFVAGTVAGNKVDYTTLTGGAYNNAVSSGVAHMEFSINGGASNGNAVTLDLSAGDAAAGKAVGTVSGAIADQAGNTLIFTVDGGAARTVTFAGVTTDLANVASQINTASTGGGWGVSASVDSSGHLVLTSATKGATSDVNVTGGTGRAAVGLAVQHNYGTSRTAGDLVNALNQAFSTDAEMQKAGLVASTSGGQITVLSNNGTYFRVNTAATATTANIGFGTGGASFSSSLSATANNTALEASGASGTSAVSYAALAYGNDDQAITVSANDSSGALQSKTITLHNDATAARQGRSIDETIDYINAQLQQSNNSTLQKIVAVKDQTGGAETIKFISSLTSFSVGIGAAGNSGEGLNSGTAVSESGSVMGSASNVSVDSLDNAKQAVTAIASAISVLGSAQAAVGKGQNQLNYAVALAQSQISNFAAAESRIRDADIAAEAANLTKAQVLQQASMAAMAQANSAPQAVLALLRG
jgi:flagellin